MNVRGYYITLIFALHAYTGYAQQVISSDELLKQAKIAAFESKDYSLAKKYLFQALQQSPNYTDISIFLGRIYAWTNQYDSAVVFFESAIKLSPSYVESYIAYSDLLYWNNQNTEALSITNAGLSYQPESTDLLIRKAKILNQLRIFGEAQIIVQQLILKDKNNTTARLLANRIRENASKNRIGISYDYTGFDKQFNDPWHLLSIDYGRTTALGSVIGRINYANRFAEPGYQYEIEAYPRISKVFYSYVSGGYSEQVGVFPKWRSGFSLYANLPKSYEAELGFRYLKFSGTPVWIYTGYIGKYYKSWLFGARTYVTPGTFIKKPSFSYSASARYYMASADDMIAANIGYGISPDDRFNNIQINNVTNLVSYRAGLTFRKKVSTFHVFTIDAGWFNQEYLPDTKGNQYQFSIAWLLRF